MRIAGLVLVLVVAFAVLTFGQRSTVIAPARTFYPVDASLGLAVCVVQFLEQIEVACPQCTGQTLREPPVCRGHRQCTALLANPNPESFHCEVSAVLGDTRGEQVSVSSDGTRLLASVQLPPGVYNMQCTNTGGTTIPGTIFAVGSKPTAFQVALEMQPVLKFPPSKKVASKLPTTVWRLLTSALEVAHEVERKPFCLFLHLPSKASKQFKQQMALWADVTNQLLPMWREGSNIGVYFVESVEEEPHLRVSISRLSFQRSIPIPLASAGEVTHSIVSFMQAMNNLAPPSTKIRTIAQSPLEKSVWIVDVPCSPSQESISVILTFIDPSGSPGEAIIASVYEEFTTIDSHDVVIHDDNSALTVTIACDVSDSFDSLTLLLHTALERFVADTVYFHMYMSSEASLRNELCVDLTLEDPAVHCSESAEDMLDVFKLSSFSNYDAEGSTHLNPAEEQLVSYEASVVVGTVFEERTTLGQWQFEEVLFSDIGMVTDWATSSPVPPHCLYDTKFSPTTAMKGHFCQPDAMSMSISAADVTLDDVDELFFRSGRGLAVYQRISSAPLRYRDRSADMGLVMDVGRGFVTSVATADVDQDGNMDVVVGYADIEPEGALLYIFLSNGDGKFRPPRHIPVSGPPAPIGMVSVTIGDYDGDGFPDILTQEWFTTYRKLGMDVGQSMSQSRLFKNMGIAHPGYFADVTVTAGLDTSKFWKRTCFHLAKGDYGLSAAFVDLDQDGLLDIIWTGDFGLSTIFWNTGACDWAVTAGSIPGEPCFEELSFATTGVGKEENGMGTTVHDLNGDGLLDFVVSSIHSKAELVNKCRSSIECAFGMEGNKAYINLGSRRFAEVSNCLGIAETNWSWGLDFVDFDNDGDLDFVVVNGFSLSGSTNEDAHNDSPDRLFRNIYAECTEGTLTGTICEPIDDCLIGRGLLDPTAGTRRLSRYIEVSGELGFNSTLLSKSAIAIDVDSDGDMDMIVCHSVGPCTVYLNTVGSASGHLLRVRPLTTLATPAWHATIRIWDHDDSGPPDHMQVVGVSSSSYQSQAPLTMHFGLGPVTTLHTVEVAFVRPSTTVIRLHNVPVDMTLTVQDQGQSIEADYCDVAGETRSGTTATGAAGENTSPSAMHAGIQLAEMPVASHHYDSESLAAFSALVNSWATSILTDSANVTAEFHTIDGWGNNVEHPSWGAPGKLLRLFEAAYDDGVEEPPQQGRSSARAISNALAEQVGDVPSGAGLTAMFTDWGQFLSHDLTLANPLSASMTLDNQFPIAVPAGDLVFDLEATGTQLLRFTRTTYAAGSGSEAVGARQQVNHHSSFIDASNVYGPDERRSRLLRDGGGGGRGGAATGRMATSADGLLLPREEVAGTAKDNPTGRSSRNLYATGDHRGNEQPGLLALHTLLVREHNLVHDLLVSARPQLGAAEAFELARSFVIAEVQHVTVAEYLPLLLGAARVPDCAAYDVAVRPQVYNEFAAAAFRFGHSQVGSRLQVGRRGAAGSREVPLRDAFFVPEYLARHGLEAVLAGMATTVAQEVDVRLVEDLRSFLFDSGRGAGLDLFALNVQRGRDHGLPSYLSVSRQLGLDDGCRAFACLPFEAEDRAALASLYAAADDVDLFVGGLLEAHVDGGSVGPVFAELIRRQMRALCVGDRLWYSRRLERIEGGHAAAAAHMGLANIIARHVESPPPSTFVHTEP